LDEAYSTCLPVLDTSPVLWPKGHKNCDIKSVHSLLDTILVFLNHTDTALCDILYNRLENTLTLIFIVLNPLYFYRAMHFSAKRGIAIACRLSVCLSVCLSVTCVNCDHIGWNSSKIISPLVCLGRSLFATPTGRVCSKRNTPKFGPQSHPPPADLNVGDIRLQIAAEWLHIAQRSQWRAYRKPPSLFAIADP